MDVNGRTVQFEQYVRPITLGRLDDNESLSIQYIPNKSNTERPAGSATRLSPLVLVSLAFLAGLVYAIR